MPWRGIAEGAEGAEGVRAHRLDQPVHLPRGQSLYRDGRVVGFRPREWPVNYVDGLGGHKFEACRQARRVAAGQPSGPRSGGAGVLDGACIFIYSAQRAQVMGAATYGAASRRGARPLFIDRGFRPRLRLKYRFARGLPAPGSEKWECGSGGRSRALAGQAESQCFTDATLAPSCGARAGPGQGSPCPLLARGLAPLVFPDRANVVILPAVRVGAGPAGRSLLAGLGGTALSCRCRDTFHPGGQACGAARGLPWAVSSEALPGSAALQGRLYTICVVTTNCVPGREA